MHRNRNIFHLFLFVGILSFGCSSKPQNNQETSEKSNHVDHVGLKQGVWKIYEDSILVSKGAYVDDLREGLWTSWYINGQMKEEGNYEKGIKEGMWIEWYRDGEIMWKGEWNHGIRKIEHPENQLKVTILGINHSDHTLASDSTYRLNIRILNIPAENVFVEVSNGQITKEAESDLFILKTSSDSIITMAIGYIPDLNFKDFRNLISEIDFELR